MTLNEALLAYENLLRKLSKYPLNPKINPYQLKLTKEEQEDFYSELILQFTELFYEYDSERGVDFPYYIQTKLGWRAHKMALKLIKEKEKFADLPVENLEEKKEEKEKRERMAYIHPKLIAALETLPPRQKQVLEMIYYQKMGLSEIARELGITPQSVYVSKKIALKKLKKKLS